MDSAPSGVIVADPGPTPSQDCQGIELEEQHDEILRDLEPVEYREVILMRDYYEADWEAIRISLGRPSIEAVQDLYHRARRRLDERMKKLLG